MPRQLSEQEFNAIRQRVLQDAPPDLTPEDFDRYYGPAMAQAIGEAENSPPEPQGSAGGRFLSNLGATLNPITMVEGAYHAVRHPIDTAMGIVNAQLDQGRHAIDLAKEGRYSEAVGHGMASVVPILGPAAAAAGEQIGSGDIAGGLGTGGGLLATVVAPEALQQGKKVVSSRLRETAARKLEQGAANRYVDVMAPKVGPNKTRFGGMAEDVAPELAKNPDMSAWSRAGLQRAVGSALDDATAALDAAADARNAGAPIPTKPLLDALRAARQKLVAEPFDGGKLPNTSQGRSVMKPGEGQVFDPRKVSTPIGKEVVPAPSQPRVAAIDKVISEVEALGDIAPYEALRRIRASWDTVAKQIYSPSVTSDFLAKTGEKMGAADSTAAIRETLAQADQDTALANTGYSLAKSANDVLEATAEVERTRPKVGRALVARWTGALAGGQAAGPAGAITGYLLAPLADSMLNAGFTTKLKTAQLMSRLAQAIRSGNVEEAVSLTDQIKSVVMRTSPQAAVATQRNLSLVPTAAGSPPPTEEPRVSR